MLFEIKSTWSPMIRSVKIENFKSVRELELELGRVTVLIGANGSGKSNILEAIGMASAVATDKLDNEFVVSRGIRMPVRSELLLSAFINRSESPVANVSVRNDDTPYVPYTIQPYVVFGGDTASFRMTGWFTPDAASTDVVFTSDMRDRISALLLNRRELEDDIDQRKYLAKLSSDLSYSKRYLADPDAPEGADGGFARSSLRRFLIYSPENRELRTFAEEGQILPLGIRGEGLFGHLKYLANRNGGVKLARLKEKLQLIDWFEDFEFPTDAFAYERNLHIRDRFLNDDIAYIDQRSANEGFLYLLFYFCLLISDATPPFFAIDNIDASLNPKLCERLIQDMVELARENSKQFILTTHNPAILDGLDLNDPEQRLYSVRRNIDGETIASRIEAPEAPEGQTPLRLSEAYLRGYLGGLPTNF